MRTAIRSRDGTGSCRQTISTSGFGVFGLFLLVAGILFPFGWVGQEWSPFGAVLGEVFGSPQQHAIGHSLLFLGLGQVMLVLFPGLRRRIWLYYTVSLLIPALGQEWFQFLYKHEIVWSDEVFDLLSDVAGATAALVLATCYRWSQRSMK